MVLKKKIKKTFKAFRAQIRSRHKTHNVLRDSPIWMNFKSVIRLGSTTELKDTIAKGGNRIEINTTTAVKNSANKKLMKQCFTKEDVKTANWFIYNTMEGIFNLPNEDGIEMNELPYPIVAKHIYGSRGTGNTLLKTKEELESWSIGKALHNYIFEKFYNYSREYRLHITSEGCFYTCRKMLIEDTPEDKRWFRNDSNSIWYLENNEKFDKPVNWSNIEKECVKALNSVGLDIGACDVKVQSSKNKHGEMRENPEFIVIEINSAPSFGNITSIKYKEILPKLLKNKFING
jgi:glutathione synthase/RimK-type ligase-like ATP-grasp enzyme